MGRKGNYNYVDFDSSGDLQVTRQTCCALRSILNISSLNEAGCGASLRYSSISHVAPLHLLLQKNLQELAVPLPIDSVVTASA